MNFIEAVRDAHDWAESNGATIHITKVMGINGGDGKVWDSFMISTVGAPPGAFAADNPEITDFFHKMTEPFDFMAG